MNSLDYRKDGRTLEEFQEHISDFTEREMYWGTILRYDFTEKNRPCFIEESGVDNKGNLIEGRLPNYNVDKVFHFLNGKKINVEIKTIPEGVTGFFTFKESSLKNCIQQEAYLIVPRSWAYFIFPKKVCEYICEKYPSRIYPKFSKNDPAKRIYIDQIEKLIHTKEIIKQEWSKKAKKLIEINYNILFRKKYES